MLGQLLPEAVKPLKDVEEACDSMAARPRENNPWELGRWE
jgi:hypothetical protein